MVRERSASKADGRACLTRLARDRSANTLAMMAAALIPLTALVGSGVDTARTYVVKTRLQQACDAGVLAGRKFMALDGATTLDAEATRQARRFFNNNFASGWQSTRAVKFTPVRTSEQRVRATASAEVPMALMRIFGKKAIVVDVTCEARYDVADSDIMFVLDVTGSMACRPEDTSCAPGNTSYTDNGVTRFAAVEQTGSRMQSLREAVVDFEATVRAAADPTTRIRYGFVPYASGVNVGAVIPQQHMVRDRWTYQSRRVVGDRELSSSNEVASGYNQSNCSTANRREPATGFTTNGTATRYTDATWDGWNNRCIVTRRNLRALWRMEPVEHDVSGYYQTLFNNSTVVDPTRLDNRTMSWQGCIEERQTEAVTSFDIDDLPADLDPNLIPTDAATRWKPMWPDVVWGRGGNAAGIELANPDADFENSGNFAPYNAHTRAPGGFAACPPPARRLAPMTAAQVSAYVNANNFRPHGGTYHDIGMIWGVRMISPDGVFAADNAPPVGRPAPNRHIVFMTDGQLAPNGDIYGAYALQRYDNRVGGGTNLGELTLRHNRRFQAVCQFARDRMNVTVWVVAFGTDLTPELTACATPGNHAFVARNRDELQTAFRSIAEQVAMLRVSQ